MVVHTCNSSYWEVEVGKSLSEVSPMQKQDLT
jgi:hypothetical protein